MSNSTPDSIGPYSVEEVIDKGTFGVVYKGHDEERGEVAIKVASTPFGDLPTRELVWQQNEIETLQKLNHPSVVTVYDHGFLQDGRLYLVMELIHGMALNRHMRDRRPLEPLEALAIGLRVTEALAHCHAEGVLHLDLKPKNIMVVDPHAPTVKVLDFGLARLSDTWDPVSDRTAGTPEYMAPECFESKRPEPDATVDLYALGTILYEMLAGHLPFQDTNLMELYKAKCRFELAPISKLHSSVPAELDTFIRQLLAPDRNERSADSHDVLKLIKGLYYGLLGLSTDLASVSAVSAVRSRVTKDIDFVGREEVLERLDDLLTQTAEKGQIACLKGPVGIGKSRLLQRFISRARQNADVWVGLGRCRQYGALVPFAPLREALSHVANTLRKAPRKQRHAAMEALKAEVGDDLRLLSTYVPEFAPLLSHIEQDVQARMRIPAAQLVASVLRRTAAALGSVCPLVLMIEDLDLADDGTMAALTELLSEPLPVGLFLVGTARMGDSIPEQLQSSVISVDPLTRRQNDALISDLLQTEDRKLIHSLKSAVPLLKEGIPLLTLQLLHNLEEEGCLVRRSDQSYRLDRQALQGYSPPGTVLDVLARNLSRVSQSTRRVLGVAGLLGMEFDSTDLEALGVLEIDTVEAALAEATRHHIVYRQRDRLVFAHEDLRRAVIEALPDGELPDLHRRVARRLEHIGAPPDRYAWHLEEGGDLVAAARCYIHAASRPEALFDPEQTFRKLKRAITLLEELESGPSYDILLARAAFEAVRIGVNLGPLEPLKTLLDRVEPRLQKAARTRLGFDAASAWYHYLRGDLAKAIELSERCLAATPGEVHDRFHLAPANIVGRALCASGRFTRAAEVLTKACKLAREAEEFAELCHSMGMLALALGFHGQLDRAARTLIEARSVANALNDPVRILGTMCYEAIATEYLHDWDRAIRTSVDVLRFAEEHEIGGLYLYLGTMFAGRAQFHVGRLDRAQVLLANSLHLARNLDVAMGIGWAHAFLGDVWLVDGQLDRAREYYEKGLAIADQALGDAQGKGLCLTGLGHVSALEGQRDQSDLYFAQAVETAELAGNLGVQPQIHQRQSDALTHLGDVEAAAKAKRQARLAFKVLGIKPVDWWPRVPESMKSRDSKLPDDVPEPGPTTSREFWLQRFTNRLADAEDIDLEELRATVKDVAFKSDSESPDFLLDEVNRSSLRLFEPPTQPHVPAMDD